LSRSLFLNDIVISAVSFPAFEEMEAPRKSNVSSICFFV